MGSFYRFTGQSDAIPTWRDAISPRIPGVFPRIPAVFPRIPTVIPRSPAVIPRIPAVIPRIPAVIPRSPGVFPRIPGVIPRIPGVSDGNPGIFNSNPGVSERNPGVSGIRDGVVDGAPLLLRGDGGGEARERGLEGALHDGGRGSANEAQTCTADPNLEVNWNYAAIFTTAKLTANGAFASTGVISIVNGDPYVAWAAGKGLNSGNNVKSADPDGDGHNNLHG